MYDNNSTGLSYTAGFFILIAFAIVGLLIASFISVPIWTSMTGKSIEVLQKGLIGPEDSNTMKIIQTISAIVGFLIPAIITAAMLNRKPFRLIGFTGKISWKQVSLVFAIIVAALFVSGFLSYVNAQLPITASMKLEFDKMEREYNQQVEAIIGLNNVGEYILSLIVMAFLPALCEETLFRGGLQNFLTRSIKMPWLSIIIVSIIFSLAHFSFYGFLSRFFLGVILGLLYQYSGRVWLNILAHFFNNALAITALYVSKVQGKPIKEAIAGNSSSSLGILALPVLVVLLYFFHKIFFLKKEASPFSIEEKQENNFHGI